MEGVSGERRRVGESESCLLVLKEGVREESLCQALVWKKTVRFTKITSSDVSLYEGRERRLTVIKTPPQGSLEGQQGVGFSLKQGSLDSPWVVVML